MLDADALPNYDDYETAKTNLKKETKLKKDKELFLRIKASIDLTCFDQQEKPSDFVPSTKQARITKVMNANRNIGQNTARNTYNYYIIGKVFKALKSQNKNYHARFQSDDLGTKYQPRF